MLTQLTPAESDNLFVELKTLAGRWGSGFAVVSAVVTNNTQASLNLILLHLSHAASILKSRAGVSE